MRKELMAYVENPAMTNRYDWLDIENSKDSKMSTEDMSSNYKYQLDIGGWLTLENVC
jgi:hypothetical protein